MMDDLMARAQTTGLTTAESYRMLEGLRSLQMLGAPYDPHSHVSGALSEKREIHFSAVFGLRCVVWAFATVLEMVTVGDDCSIGGSAEIGHHTTIGSHTRISRGVFLPNRSTVGSHVFIGPNCTFTDDRYPKVLAPGERYTAEPPIIEDHVSIGAGAVILPGVRIGHHARIAAGAVVTKDVPSMACIIGVPGRRFDMPERWAS